MGIETERKFLLLNDNWRKEVTEKYSIRQGYIVKGDVTIRVRIAGNGAFLTIKKRCANADFARTELQYPIPLPDAELMLDTMCQKPLIEKIRHIVPCGEFKWEIDEFFGHKAGLVMAEIELPDEKTSWPQPDWLGKEVTYDSAYYNSNM